MGKTAVKSKRVGNKSLGSRDPNQNYFNGLEPKRYPELDKLVTEWADNRETMKMLKERRDFLEEEIASFLAVNKIKSYICGPVDVQLLQTKRAKFRKVKKADQVDGGDEVGDEILDDPEL